MTYQPQPNDSKSQGKPNKEKDEAARKDKPGQMKSAPDRQRPEQEDDEEDTGRTKITEDDEDADDSDK